MHLVGFITKKLVTMHGHMNVKYVCYFSVTPDVQLQLLSTVLLARQAAKEFSHHNNGSKNASMLHYSTVRGLLHFMTLHCIYVSTVHRDRQYVRN